MVYAGYAPAKLPTELSSLQRSLKKVSSVESLDIIGKLVKNAACSPHDDKFKSVKTSNPKINALIMDTPGALDAMKELGWTEQEESLRCDKAPTMAQYRDIEAAKADLKKDKRKEEVAKLRKG